MKLEEAEYPAGSGQTWWRPVTWVRVLVQETTDGRSLGVTTSSWGGELAFYGALMGLGNSRDSQLHRGAICTGDSLTQ